MLHGSLLRYYYHICEVTIFASTAELSCAFH
uniref:Uncharacterized protein n=1 Tax=Arundo donax TaxID=35708 RepID=A0A0A9EM36_ARUDO